MTLFVVGLNHKTAPVNIREKVAFNEWEIPKALEDFKREFPKFEGVILSTCNRMEIYIATPNNLKEIDPVVSFICKSRGIEEKEFEKFLYKYADRDAVYHLFSVASSIDSMVVGEAEILGQVKRAHNFAKEQKTAGKIFNNLFQKSINVAKMARSCTEIGTGKVSVSSVAIDFAGHVFQEFKDKTVLVIGAGETGEVTLKHLIRRGIKKIIITNRTYEKAWKLAGVYNGVPLKFDLLDEGLVRADIIVSSTSAQDYIVQFDRLEKAMQVRKNRPLFIVDLAIPRDVDPKVQDINGVYLYNIDDLKSAAEKNKKERENEISECEDLIKKETENFMSWLLTLNVGPVFKRMEEELKKIKEEELDRLFRKMGDLSEKDRKEIGIMAERLVNKIFHTPKKKVKDHMARTKKETYLEIFKDMFSLNDKGKR